MSILALQKATLIGLTENKPAILDALQALGLMHIIPLAEPDTQAKAAKTDVSPEQLSTILSYLLGCKHKRRQILLERHFDLGSVVADAEENRLSRLKLLERRDFLKKRIKDLSPWGNFVLPDHDELYQQRLWFYLVPNYRMHDVEKIALPWQAVFRDNRHTYVAVISPKEPAVNLMPVLRTHTGAVPLEQLKSELEDSEIELEKLEAEREAMTRWIYLLQRSVAGIQDLDQRCKVSNQTLDREEIFAVQGWVAKEMMDRLRTFVKEQRIVLHIEEVCADEQPPTLLSNPTEVAGGEEVVHFFQMPGYRAWDPSRVVFFSFVGFFALIMSDAGYSLLMALCLLFYWKRMSLTETGRRLRALGMATAGAGLIWGVMVESYFGATAPFDWLASLKVMDLYDFDSMMKLSICIGVGHLFLANLMMAWVKRQSHQWLAPIGWALLVLIALIGWLTTFHLWHWLGMVASLGLVLLFSSERTDWSLNRWIDGLQGLTSLTKMFGDILSYLRLFALGMASASLAMTFNKLAIDVAAAMPAIGLLFKVLILLAGHLINFALTVVSGVIHGLRLNLLEFYNWSLADEGYAFQPFAKREVTSWIT